MPDVQTTGRFDFTLPAEVYIGRGIRRRPGLRYKGFDSAAEAIRYVMEEPRPAGEAVTLESNDERYTLAQIAGLYHDTGYPLPRITTAAEVASPARLDIAVPIKRGPARVRPDDNPPPPLRQAASVTPPGPQRHRYKVGARLRMNNGGNSLARQAAYCRVTFALPYEGGQLLYRVKSEVESFERVVAEGDLSPA